MTSLITTVKGARSSRHEAFVPQRYERDAQFESSDDGRFRVLLDEPAVALWASEAAERYGISALHALRLLAQALVLDAQ
jgi:hypothetical protein